jgi:hypothetical protein
MLHDNARPHTAATTQYLIMTFGWEQFDHPPYSSDLAPSDFHVLQDNHEVKEAINTWFA